MKRTDILDRRFSGLEPQYSSYTDDEGIAKGVAAGASIGAAVGTILPGVGNVAGGAIGAVLGAAAGNAKGFKGRTQYDLNRKNSGNPDQFDKLYPIMKADRDMFPDHYKESLKKGEVPDDNGLAYILENWMKGSWGLGQTDKDNFERIKMLLAIQEQQQNNPGGPTGPTGPTSPTGTMGPTGPTVPGYSNGQVPAPASGLAGTKPEEKKNNTVLYSGFGIGALILILVVVIILKNR